MHVIINKELMNQIRPYGTIKTYRSNEFIYMEEDPASFLYIIQSGRIRAFLVGKNGESITLEVLKKGRIFGDSALMSHTTRPVNIQAVTDVTILVIPINDVIRMTHQNQELMLLLFEHMEELIARLTRQIYALTTYNTTQKIANFLIEETNHGKETLPYTHENIAECLGISRVSVSRNIKKMQESGAVDYHYGIVKVLDIKQLEELLRNE